MKDAVTLNIPLKSYLKKYLLKKFGSTHQASRNSWLGAYVIDLLDKEYRKQNTVLKKDTFYSVSIPLSVVCDNGFAISKVKLLRLEVMIRKVFFNDVYSYINVSVGNNLKLHDEKHDSIIKQNVTRAIAQFLSFYDIKEDELSSDYLYRQYFRDKKVTEKEQLKTHSLLDV